MSQSTPINLLRRNGNGNENTNIMENMDNMNAIPNMSMNSNDMPILDNNNVNMSNQPSESQLVEDILKEMGDSPGMEQQTNINSQALQYAMDSSQVPAYKHMDNEHIQPMNPNNNYSEKMVHQQLNNNGLLSQIGINISGESLKDKIMKNFKYPILVFILSFIISLPEFNRFLFSFCPRLLLESGQVSIGGVLMKAFVGMLLFIIIALFL